MKQTSEFHRFYSNNILAIYEPEADLMYCYKLQIIQVNPMPVRIVQVSFPRFGI